MLARLFFVEIFIVANRKSLIKYRTEIKKKNQETLPQPGHTAPESGTSKLSKSFENRFYEEFTKPL